MALHVSARRAAFLLAVGTACFLTNLASAQNFVLTIDDSNPFAVTITTTGSFSSADSSATTTLDGVTLLNFFTSEIDGNGFTNSSNFTTSDPTIIFDRWVNDNSSGANVDLNLYNGNPGEIQTFTTTSPAFSGSASYNFSAFAAQLPFAFSGTFGDVIAGDSGNPSGDQVVVGSWQVVPEPGASALLVLGGLFFGVAIYRRHGLER